MTEYNGEARKSLNYDEEYCDEQSMSSVVLGVEENPPVGSRSKKSVQDPHHTVLYQTNKSVEVKSAEPWSNLNNYYQERRSRKGFCLVLGLVVLAVVAAIIGVNMNAAANKTTTGSEKFSAFNEQETAGPTYNATAAPTDASNVYSEAPAPTAASTVYSEAPAPTDASNVYSVSPSAGPISGGTAAPTYTNPDYSQTSTPTDYSSKNDAYTASPTDTSTGQDSYTEPPTDTSTGQDSYTEPPTDTSTGQDSYTEPPTDTSTGQDSYTEPPTDTSTGQDSYTEPPTEGASLSDVYTDPPSDNSPCTSTWVQPTKDCFTPGESIQVSFENCEAVPKDWIGIYPDNGVDPYSLGSSNLYDWKWSCGSRKCNTGWSPKTGTMDFSVDSEGTYIAFLIHRNQGGGEPYKSFQSSSSFQVASSC